MIGHFLVGTLILLMMPFILLIFACALVADLGRCVIDAVREVRGEETRSLREIARRVRLKVQQ